MNTIEQAFQIIDKQTVGIPYEAINFLRNSETTTELTDKIVDAISNAYNGEKYYNQTLRLMMPTPLWYAVVAEKHLCEALFQPILQLFDVEEDWDLLNEQAVYLVGLLAKKYPEKFIKKVLEYIKKSIDKDNKKPYLYSFEALYYAKEEQFEQIHNMLYLENFLWLDHYVRILGDINHPDTLSHFKKLLPKVKGTHVAIELQYYIDAMEGKGSMEKGVAFCEMRNEDWEKHYCQMEQIFAANESPVVENKQVGRNDACPCGSGKKYKHCCLNS